MRNCTAPNASSAGLRSPVLESKLIAIYYGACRHPTQGSGLRGGQEPSRTGATGCAVRALLLQPWPKTDRVAMAKAGSPDLRARIWGQGRLRCYLGGLL